MSDSDEDSSSSGEEDEDYLPSGEDYSEDDVSELVKEDDVEEDNQLSRGRCKKNSQEITCRTKKKGNVLFLEPDGKGSSEDSESEEDEPEESQNAQKDETVQRKKEDALWASFLSDVGQKPKESPDTKSLQTQKDEPAEEKSLPEPHERTKEPEKKKVTITKVFDFAGEEVRVTQEVDPTSKEARLFLKQEEGKAAGPAPDPAVSGAKRPAGLNSLLGKMGAKRQKMSTLEKSKLDWETFKAQEGIGEELATHNRGKDGFLERKAFLERVDHRQFEIERDIRLSNMKP